MVEPFGGRQLKQNLVKKRLKEGGTCVGTMLRICKTAHAIPLFAAAGWDYVIVDTEHVDFNNETLSTMALAAKYEDLGFFVRVPDKLYHQLAGILDLGAEGLILPRVDTPRQVREIVESTRYFPIGSRGASIPTTVTLFRPCGAVEYMEWANRETLIVVQIESVEGVERVDEIVAAEQVDAVMIGPFDLSQSMGIPGQLEDPRLEKAFDRVIEACDRHGVAPGIHLTRLPDVKKWLGRGMRFLTYQYDAGLLLSASQDALTALGREEGTKKL